MTERLLRDPHPDVIRQLLSNPKVTEEDVLSLAARRPCRPDVLAQIARTPRWTHRPRIRMALVLNPDTPLEVAAPLVGLLMRQELRLVATSTTVAPALRALCLEHSNDVRRRRSTRSTRRSCSERRATELAEAGSALVFFDFPALKGLTPMADAHPGRAAALRSGARRRAPRREGRDRGMPASSSSSSAPSGSAQTLQRSSSLSKRTEWLARDASHRQARSARLDARSGVTQSSGNLLMTWLIHSAAARATARSPGIQAFRRNNVRARGRHPSCTGYCIAADRVIALAFALGCATVPPLPPKALELNLNGAAALAAGDLSTAEARFSVALEYSPRFTEAWVNLGYVELRRGNLERARKHFVKARDLNPDLPAPHHALGLLADRRDIGKEAEGHYRQALKVDPGFVPSRSNLASAPVPARRVRRRRASSTSASRRSSPSALSGLPRARRVPAAARSRGARPTT